MIQLRFCQSRHGQWPATNYCLTAQHLNMIKQTQPQHLQTYITNAQCSFDAKEQVKMVEFISIDQVSNQVSWLVWLLNIWFQDTGAVVLRLGTFCFDEFHIGGDVCLGDALSSLLGAGLGSFAFASNLLYCPSFSKAVIDTSEKVNPNCNSNIVHKGAQDTF